MPNVSVIIPTYNRKDYVQEAIDSVLAQAVHVPQDRLVDDGSTDCVGRVLRERNKGRMLREWQMFQDKSMMERTSDFVEPFSWIGST